ncbi:hypothetical protein NE237_027476 [Protea cynaroides]|uniref:Uncharacterized protein n=1 Tax=Protea cynaroides TaxID=273540 RepID=A0A9Q0JRY8_9MAGN|nr:hypothetical protein NE237_027476 [Protea cynaroides]
MMTDAGKVNAVAHSNDTILTDVNNGQDIDGVVNPTIVGLVLAVNEVSSEDVESVLPLAVISTRAGTDNTSIITSSPGRVEVSFAGVMLVDESLSGHGGDFVTAGKRPPRRPLGRGNSQTSIDGKNGEYRPRVSEEEGF